MEMPVKTVHNLTCPGAPPAIGDVVEIELVDGRFVCRLDPVTRVTGAEHQRFLWVNTFGAVRPLTE